MMKKAGILLFIVSIFLLNTEFSFGKVHQYGLDDSDPFDEDVVVLDKQTNSFAITPLQQKQIDFFILEKDSKIAAMEKELAIRKKLFQEELYKPNNEISSIQLEDLMQEIQEITFTIERIKIDFQLNVRNILSPRQYSIFMQKQEKQEKKKKK